MNTVQLHVNVGVHVLVLTWFLPLFFFFFVNTVSDFVAVYLKSIGVSWPVDEAYCRLTTRQPERFWTSGQWMTERQGGSDVGQCCLS